MTLKKPGSNESRRIKENSSSVVLTSSSITNYVGDNNDFSVLINDGGVNGTYHSKILIKKDGVWTEFLNGTDKIYLPVRPLGMQSADLLPGWQYTTWDGANGSGELTAVGTFFTDLTSTYNNINPINTTITSPSNGLSLPQATINVNSTYTPTTLTSGVDNSGTNLSYFSTSIPGITSLTLTVPSTAGFASSGTLKTSSIPLAATVSSNIANITNYIPTNRSLQFDGWPNSGYIKITTSVGTQIASYSGFSFGNIIGVVGASGSISTGATVECVSADGTPLFAAAVITYTGKTSTTFTGCTCSTYVAPYQVGTSLTQCSQYSGALLSSTFPTSGTLLVNTSSGVQSVAYTGKTSTTFTGCSGGVGTMNTGGSVTTRRAVLQRQRNSYNSGGAPLAFFSCRFLISALPEAGRFFYIGNIYSGGSADMYGYGLRIDSSGACTLRVFSTADSGLDTALASGMTAAINDEIVLEKFGYRMAVYKTPTASSLYNSDAASSTNRPMMAEIRANVGGYANAFASASFGIACDSGSVRISSLSFSG
jgi:hypothetical protein